MKKTFACAFVLFMFASTTTALAGDKRFCGWVALDGGDTGNTNIAAGSWYDKGSLIGHDCDSTLKKAKKGLKDPRVGLWEGRDWQKKDGYKCKNVSKDFRDDGKNICGKKNYMKWEQSGYLIIKDHGQAAEVEEVDLAHLYHVVR